MKNFGGAVVVIFLFAGVGCGDPIDATGNSNGGAGAISAGGAGRGGGTTVEPNAEGGNGQPDASIGDAAANAPLGGAGVPTDAGPVDPNVSMGLMALPISGKAVLVGKGTNGCTNEIPAPGDRWCAFSREVELGRAELWVINVSAFAKGVPMRCVPGDSNCKRLTTNLWTGTPSTGPAHPNAHSFDGDTLIFHADATSASTELYQGPIYAWRPSWSEPRQISTKKGITCAGHFAGQVAMCLDNIEPDETKPLEFDLLAGRLDDAQAQGLPRLDRIRPTRSNDVSRWRGAFSRDGSQFCYSTGRTPTDSENLWCFLTSSLPANAVATGTRASAPLITDAARWAFSRDTQKLYYLSGYNYSDQGRPSGVLKLADYPSGQNVTTIGYNIGAFLILSDGSNTDRGVGLFTDVVENRGSFRLLRDRSAPDDYVTIANGVSTASLSGDLRYTYFSQNTNERTGLGDAYVAQNATATKTSPASRCTLQSGATTDLYGRPFLEHAGLVFWAEDVDPNLLVGKGMVANPENCTSKVKYAKDLDFWFTVGDRGLIWSDDTDTDTVSIRYAPIADGKTWPGASGTVLLQKQASRIYSMTLPTNDLLLLQAQGASKDNVIYLAKLPF
ncbi:MAG: hypothetical protein SF187_24965 [Deltaproteobacteria bacterium]|nr:hypothetical protein [Deltaproteobacteria bacterium]